MMGKKLLEIIYEDKFLVVVNKPSGIIVVPAPGQHKKDLTFLLSKQLRTESESSCVYPGHRLDKQTTGVIVFAKSKDLQQMIMHQFRKKTVHKYYIAFIQGQLKKKKGILKNYIQGAWPYHQSEGKKLALTKFKLLYKAKNFSIVKLKPITGRTNQIRIQFKNCGHPLLGERRFAFARDWPIKFRRVALHAASIEFIHPVYKRKVSFESKLPDDMANFLINNHIHLPARI